MSSLSTLPKGDSAWLLRKAIERIIQQVSVLETNIGSSTTGNSANTQVIFNDAGTLRGDPDLTFNKALNKLVATNLESTTTLVVGTSATITGDLTVDTSTLKVDSTNNRVGIGTATPADTLDVNGRVTALRYLSSSSNAALPSFAVSAGNGAYSSGANEIGFSINSTNTMTLNSTGLGIGVSPSSLLHVQKSQNADTTLIVNNTNSGAAASARLDLVCNANNSLTIQSYGQNYSGNVCGIAAAKLNAVIDNSLTANSTGLLIGTSSTNPLYFATANAVKMTLDSTGNVGIGVTPSAWGSGTSVIDLANSGNAAGVSSSGTLSIANNAFFDGTNWTYKNNATALLYQLIGGQHLWFTAGASTGTITDFASAKMVLDASGRLGIGTATPSQPLHVKLDQNAYTFSRIDNQNASSGAYAALMLGASGNSWGIGVGSVAANSNALDFILDAGGVNSLKMRLDSSGNLGIGVTPNTWTIGKHILIGGTAGAFHYGANGQAITGINAYYDSGWKYAANGAASNYEQSNGSHVWYNAPVGIAGNTATFTQAMSLNPTGNLVFPTGKGIDFSAVTGGTGTATANVLNDYEEGTFTATLTGATTNPTIAVTSTGRYTKVGRIVTVQIGFENVITTGASGTIGVTGLPFANNSNVLATCPVSFYSMATFTGSPFGEISLGFSSIQFASSISNAIFGDVTHNAGITRFLRTTAIYQVA